MKTLMEQRLEMICEWFEVEPSDIDYIAFTFRGKLLETDYRPETEDYVQRQMFASVSRDKATISSDGSIQRTKGKPQ
jgi:hypothetical protein